MEAPQTHSLALMEALVANLREWVCLVTETGEVLASSRSLTEALQSGANPVPGKSLGAILQHAQGASWGRLLETLARGGPPVVCDAFLKREVGEAITVRARLTALPATSSEAILQCVLEEKPAAHPPAHLASLAEKTDCSVFLMDAQGLTLWVNQGLTLTTGYTLADMLGKDPESVLAGPETEAGTLAALQQAVTQGKSTRVELIQYRRDGTRYWASIEIQPILDDSQRVVNFIGLHHDTTLHHESGAALREHTALLEALITERTLELKKTQQQFKSLVEFAPDALVMSDTQGIMRLVNRQAERLFGYTNEEMIGKPVDMLVPGDVRRIHKEQREDFRRHNPDVPATHRTAVRGVRRDGTEFPVEINLGMLDTPNGKMVAAIVRDVTQRHAATNALRDMEALYRRAISTANAVAYRLDYRSNRYQFIDEGIRNLSGFQAEEMTPELWNRICVRSIMRGDAAGLGVEEAIQKVRSGQLQHWRCDTLIMTKSGEERWISESSVEVPDSDGKPMSSVGILIDITERKMAEEELRKFRSIADKATYGVVITSKDGIIEYTNLAWAQLHGWKTAELVGEHLSLFHAAEQMEWVNNLLSTLHVHGGFNMEEVWHRRRDGTEFLALMSATLVRSLEGEPLYMAATCVDISERAWNQRRLNMQNSVLAALAEDRELPEVLDLLCSEVEAVHLHSACAVLRFCNGKGLKLTAGPNLPPAIHQGFSCESHSDLITSCASKMATGDAIFVNDTLTDPRWEPMRPFAQQTGIRSCWSIPIHDGDHLYGIFAIMHMAPRQAVEQDQRLLNECARLAGIAVQRDRVRQALAESESHFRALADSGNTLIWTTNAEGACDYCNKTWIEFTGRNLEQEKGRGWMENLQPEDQHRMQAAFSQAIKRRDPFTLQVRLRRKDGEYRSIEVHATPRANMGGDLTGFIGHCIDITDRLASERHMNRSQRLEAIGQLAGGVAHDLNNALAPILMTSSLMRLEHPDSAELIDAIETSARRCADMVKQLITFARGAEGERLLIQPRHLMLEMEKIIKGTFPKNIEVRLQPSQNLWTVLGDATQLHQVLLNLCVNARDAMPNGGRITIRAENLTIDETFASTEPGAKPGRYIVLEVADTGVGIPLEEQDRIFEPFYTTKGPDKGTGLGLSTVIGIVKGHGGFVRLQSEPGRGARFRVVLPASEDERLDSPHKETTPEAPFSGNGLTVLVVDDEVNVRNAMATVLGSIGFNVVLARDGTDALVCAAEKRHELRLVITDLHMPQMGGIQFVRTLQRMLPDVGIIVASGRIDARDEAELRSLGLQILLSKPFSQETLTRALRQAFHPTPQQR